MRITAKLATSAESGFVHVPTLSKSGESYLIAPGEANLPMILEEFRNNEGIMFSSDDGPAVYLLAVELLDRMNVAFDRMVASVKGVKKVGPDDRKTAAWRKYERGRYTFVRVDLRQTARGIRCKVSATNPRECVGGSEQFARYYAQTFADNLVAIELDLKQNEDNVKLEFVEGEGCEGVFERARERNRWAALRNKYWDCPNRRNGLCSPFTPTCELYKDGKCLWE